ncbi:hypothetical protein N0V88_000877 [Collariella sp. IMI 366227]|nr:hypothetical protein N0V88_000877 [Collariella sp. IMI 366227]
MAALASGIVPAQLGFLAIYNPSLGTTDATLNDQIVYYASPSTLAVRRRRQRAPREGRPTDVISQDERNERLRQIGLAQGMVEFGKSFSGGQPVDSIDTEKSRVVLHELEPGWWILAAVEEAERRSGSPAANVNNSETAGMDKMFSYLKLGYGTYWSLGTSSPAASSDADDEPTPKPVSADADPKSPRRTPTQVTSS